VSFANTWGQAENDIPEESEIQTPTDVLPKKSFRLGADHE